MISVTVSNTNLFAVAARYLNDATQATQIAALNGLAEFVIGEMTTLTLPALDPTATGGLGAPYPLLYYPLIASEAMAKPKVGVWANFKWADGSDWS